MRASLIAGLALLLVSATAAAAEPAKIALISTDRFGYEYFDLAEEAVGEGARFLLFPEWGFPAGETELSPATRQAWQSFADRHDVYVALDARAGGRNTLFVWTPTGDERSVLRRDGNGSPLPTDAQALRPLIIESEHGRVGFLICDEVRSRRYLDEMAAAGVDFILSPNNTYSRTHEAAVLERIHGLGYTVDTFHADVLSSNGLGASPGKLTFAYRAAGGGRLEFAPFGSPQPFDDFTGFRSNRDGVKYLISYHDLPASSR